MKGKPIMIPVDKLEVGSRVIWEYDNEYYIATIKSKAGTKDNWIISFYNGAKSTSTIVEASELSIIIVVVGSGTSKEEHDLVRMDWEYTLDHIGEVLEFEKYPHGKSLRVAQSNYVTYTEKEAKALVELAYKDRGPFYEQEWRDWWKENRKKLK